MEGSRQIAATVPAAPLSSAQSRGRLQSLAWLPIPILLAAIIAGRAAGLRETYENETLRLVLSFTFYTLVSLGTLYLIGRSFLASGAPGLLLLECGVVLWSLAGTVGDIVGVSDQNINVTIYNTTMLLAGLCLLGGAVLSLRPQGSLRARGHWLGAGCGLALGAILLVAWAAQAGWLPVFFVPGQGGTLVRYCVLISAAAMFVLSAVLLYAGQRGARTPFTSWYALALLLLAVGLFGIMIQLSLWSVVNWLSRTAQWLGGFYLLLAAVAALSQSNVPLLPSGERSRPGLYPYVMAVVIVLVATAIRLVFLQALGIRATFIMFYPAVIVAALYGGRRAGLTATVLSAIVADYFWIEPVGQFPIAHPADWLSLVIFLLNGGMISLVADAMLRARARASTAEADARFANERLRASDALRESEEKYRNLFENMTEEVHFWKLVRDEAGQIITWRLVDANPPTLKTWGRKTVDEIRGKTTDEVFGPGAAEHYMPIVRKVMAEGAPHVYEDYFPNLDKHFRFTTVPLGDYFITTGADITGIKKSQLESSIAGEFLTIINQSASARELVRSAVTFFHQQSHCQAVGIRLRDGDDYPYYEARGFPEEFLLLENSLCERDVDGNLQRDSVGNPCIACMCGNVIRGRFDPSKPFFSPIGSFWTNCTTELLASTTDADRQARTRNRCNGQGYESVALIPLRVGTDRSGLLQLNDKRKGMFSPQTISFWERLASYLAVALAKLDAQEALRKSVLELQRSNQELQQFAYVASHDLQEPLRQVRAFVQMLQDRHSDKLDGKANQYFQFVHDGAARMSDLVRGLLAYSRIGGREATHQSLSCQQALDTALANLQAGIAESRAVVTHDDLPTILAEPTQLTQLFQNLIGNAVKFHRDGVAPIIHVGCRPDDGLWLFWIRDNGIGIAPEFHEKVFLIFQRLHGRDKYPGTGIGLAICKKIVEQHGGKIWIESKAGEGSVFCFTVPRENVR